MTTTGISAVTSSTSKSAQGPGLARDIEGQGLVSTSGLGFVPNEHSSNRPPSPFTVPAVIHSNPSPGHSNPSPGLRSTRPPRPNDSYLVPNTTPDDSLSPSPCLAAAVVGGGAIRSTPSPGPGANTSPGPNANSSPESTVNDSGGTGGSSGSSGSSGGSGGTGSSGSTVSWSFEGFISSRDFQGTVPLL